MKNASQSTAV